MQFTSDIIKSKCGLGFIPKVQSYKAADWADGQKDKAVTLDQAPKSKQGCRQTACATGSRSVQDTGLVPAPG